MGEFREPPNICPDGSSADFVGTGHNVKHTTTSDIDISLRNIIYPQIKALQKVCRA
jgi:hypothetical protein